MKNILLFSFCFLIIQIGYTQAPNKFRYQAVARDQSGAVRTGNLDIRLSFLEDSPNGTNRYSELHTTTTNPQGVFNLTINEGSPVSGNKDLVDWKNHEYWLKVELKSAGEATFTEMGITQLLSVPYAMYASRSGSDLNAGTGIVISNGVITNNGDLDNTNELQTLSINGDQLEISDGNIVTLPTGTTYTEGAGIDINGNTINALDISPTNEIQTLSLNGQQLSLSNGGGSVQLPGVGSAAWTVNNSMITSAPATNDVVIGSNSNFNSKLYVSASGTQHGGNFYSPGSGDAIHAYSNSTGSAIFGSSLNGPGGSFSSVSGPALLTGSGNVGIGLNNPARKLHVNGSTLLTNPGGDVALEIGAGKVGIGITSPSHKFEVNGSSFFENLSGPALVTGQGRVGIGTPNPSYKLSVLGGNDDGIFGSSENGYAISGVSVGIHPAGYFHGSNGAAGFFTSDDYLCIIATQGATGTSSNNQGMLLKNEGDNWGMFVDVANDYNFSYNNVLKAYINNTDGTYHNTSDSRLKKDIQSFSNVLSRLTKLQAYTYRFKDATEDSPISLGFIAQEVEAQFPQLVIEKEGYKSLCYDHFAVLSVQAIKEQQVEIEDLKKQITELKEMVIALVKK
ncbi:MAG: tail fiber domain-containing protein [Saprospiraceae bacterium]